MGCPQRGNPGNGRLDQLVDRVLRKDEAGGSNPPASTFARPRGFFEPTPGERERRRAAGTTARPTPRVSGHPWETFFRGRSRAGENPEALPRVPRHPWRAALSPRPPIRRKPPYANRAVAAHLRAWRRVGIDFQPPQLGTRVRTLDASPPGDRAASGPRVRASLAALVSGPAGPQVKSILRQARGRRAPTGL